MNQTEESLVLNNDNGHLPTEVLNKAIKISELALELDGLYNTIYFTEEDTRYRINTDRYWVNIPVSAYTKHKTTNEIYKTIDNMFSKSILKEYKNIPLHVVKKAIGLSDDDGPKIISLL